MKHLIYQSFYKQHKNASYHTLNYLSKYVYNTQHENSLVITVYCIRRPYSIQRDSTAWQGVQKKSGFVNPQANSIQRHDKTGSQEIDFLQACLSRLISWIGQKLHDLVSQRSGIIMRSHHSGLFVFQSFL